jgi:hypothetical protein
VSSFVVCPHQILLEQSDQEEEKGGLCTGLKRNLYRVALRKPEGRTLTGGLNAYMGG